MAVNLKNMFRCRDIMLLLLSFVEIVRVTGMANFIIRLAYKPIYDKAADLFPSDFEFSTPVDQLPKL
mgnify:CR=1 FL=1